VSIEAFSICVLVIVFIVGSLTPISIGLLGFVAALIIGLASGLSTEDIVAGFPGGLFIILTGITFLFAIVQNNGTLDLITGWAQRLAGKRSLLFMATMFLLGAALSMIGTFPPAAVAIVVPIAMTFAVQRDISPFIMGVVVALGATAGEFSPINVIGALLNSLVASQDLSPFPGLLFLYGFLFNAVIAVILTAYYYGFKTLRERHTGAGVGREGTAADQEVGDSIYAEVKITPYRALTLAGLALLIVLTVAFGIYVGFAAFTVALILLLVSPREYATALRGTSWSTILLITGIVTYVGVLEKVGTLDYVQNLLEGVGGSSAMALATSYVVGIVSAFAFTTATLGAITPFVAPLLDSPDVSSVGVVCAIAVSSTIVDISPFSTMGALLLANARGVEERSLFRQLVLWTVATIAVGPLLAWLVFVATGLF